MAAKAKSDLLLKFQSEFNRITSSLYCVYKNPKNLYENLINTLAVSRKQRRKGPGVICPVETAYKDWKERGFPEVEITGEILKRVKTWMNLATKIRNK